MLEPTANNILLEIISRGEAYAESVKSHSGLLVQGDKIKQDEPDRGRIVAIGPDVAADWPGRVGDLVIYKTKEIFQGFRFDDKDLVFMRDFEVIAKITEEDA